MPSSRSAVVVALAVGLALGAVSLQVLGVLWQQQPVQHGAWRTGVVAVVLAGVWWLVNGPVEGPVLVTVTRFHGFTLADLLGVPALVAGGVLLVRVARL